MRPAARRNPGLLSICLLNKDGRIEDCRAKKVLDQLKGGFWKAERMTAVTSRRRSQYDKAGLAELGPHYFNPWR